MRPAFVALLSVLPARTQGGPSGQPSPLLGVSRPWRCLREALRHPHRAGAALLAPLLLALAAAATCTAASAQAPARFVMATHQPPDNFQGQWVRRIYTEAFRRLGVPMEVQALPLQRMTEMLDRGEIDGDVGRVHAHGLSHPELVRVEESMYDVVFGLYTLDQTIELKAIEDLGARPWSAAYVRGVAICERLLKPHIAPENLSALVTDEQGMLMLAMGRTHFYCSANHSVADAAARERFRDMPPPRLVLSMGSIALFPYLHRRHAALAPRLAAVLRDMRAEGLIERFRLEALAASRK